MSEGTNSGTPSQQSLSNHPLTQNPSDGLLEKIQLDGDRPQPSLWNATIGVIRYEFAHSLTLTRFLIWVGLICFPVALVSVVLPIAKSSDPSNRETLMALSFLMFILLPQSVTVLAMLLFAAPIVNAELESQSWIYAIVRPHARKAILLGKYVVAVLWCGSCTSVATVLIVLVAVKYKVPDVQKVLGILLALCWIAAMCYGAMFLAIGTLFQRRAMVYAFAYSIGVEALMGWVPAVVNLFTVSYRLRSLLFTWFSSQKSIELEEFPFLWEDHPIKHLAILCLIVVGLLALAIWRIDRNQYRWQSEA